MFVKGHLRMSSRGPLTPASAPTVCTLLCLVLAPNTPKIIPKVRCKHRHLQDSHAHMQPQPTPTAQPQVLLSWRPSWLLQLRARTMTQLQAWSLRSRQQLGALRRCSSRP